MKLVRLGPPGAERPAALLDDGSLADLSPVVADLGGEALAPSGLAAIGQRLAAGDLPLRPERWGDPELRVGAPVARPGTVVCIGLNYRDHAGETGAPPPAEPVVFLKATNTVVGPYDDLLIPVGSTKTDYEVELAVVLGGTARYLPSPGAALSVVAGYAVSNDVSEREFQLERGGQWDKGKCCETFNPLGPWLATADEVPDPGALALGTTVNGEQRQSSSTSAMIFDVAHLVWYVSQFMVLQPGDIINTGTPAGVALGRGSGYLAPGDVVEVSIEGLGGQRSRCVAARP